MVANPRNSVNLVPLIPTCHTRSFLASAPTPTSSLLIGAPFVCPVCGYPLGETLIPDPSPNSVGFSEGPREKLEGALISSPSASKPASSMGKSHRRSLNET